MGREQIKKVDILTETDKNGFIEFLSKVLPDVDTNQGSVSPFDTLNRYNITNLQNGGGGAAGWCMIIGFFVLCSAAAATGGAALIVPLIIGGVMFIGGLLVNVNELAASGGRKSRRTRVNKRYRVKCLKKSKRRKQSCGKKRRY